MRTSQVQLLSAAMSRSIFASLPLLPTGLSRSQTAWEMQLFEHRCHPLDGRSGLFHFPVCSMHAGDVTVAPIAGREDHAAAERNFHCR